MADPFDYGVNYLSSTLGLTPEQARGAVRWMNKIESGLNPSIVNPTSGAYGIAQWLGPRKQSLFQSYGSSPSIEQQFSHVASELRGPEAKALQALRGTKTEDEAFRVWGKEFERPSPAEYAKATGGYSSGLRSSGRPEGYYDNSLNITLRPEKPEAFPFDLAIDALLGGKPIGEAEPGEDHPLALIDALLGPGPKTGGEAKLAQPAFDTIEPPGPTPPQPSGAEQFALPPAATAPAPQTQVPGMEAAQPSAPPSQPDQLLDHLLKQSIEPPAQGQAPPQPPPAQPQALPMQSPSALLDALLKGVTSSMQGATNILPNAARGATRGAEAGFTGTPITEPPTSVAETVGMVPGAIGGALLSPLHEGGKALQSTMAGEPVAAQQMLTAAMAGMDPVGRLPGGVRGEAPGVMERLWSDQSGGATRSGRGAPPPAAPGFVRFYHGADPGAAPTTGGSRWVTQDPNYARNFRAMDGPKDVWYVDLPKDHPSVEMAQMWDKIDEMGQTNMVGRYAHFEVPEREAAGFKLMGGGAGEPPKPPPPPPREPAPARGPAPVLDPPIEGEGLRQIVTRIDDALHRVLTNATADKIEVNKWWGRLPRIYKDKKVSAAMADDVERRMIDPEAELMPVTQKFLDGPGKRLAWNENRLGNALRRMLGDDAKYADLPSAAEGYAHRTAEAPPGGRREEALGRLDPEHGRTTDAITGSMAGGRGRSLSRFAPGMQHRAPRFVLQDEAGNRVFNRTETLETKGYEYGQKITTRTAQGGTKEWTVKPPTMAEMEANTPVRYHRDYVGNLVNNVLRLARIKRNVELLNDLKTELGEKGLFHPEGNNRMPPEGFVRVDLPQLRGYAEPKIAAVLNDFWNGADSDLFKFLNNVNRFLVGTLFVTPVPHVLNVAMHWAVGRGWDWLSIPAYIRGARSGAKALNAVWNLTPEYVRMLREGSGLLYGDTAMENFYNQLMKQTWQEQLRNPEVWADYAKQVMGKPYKLPMDALTAVKDLVKAEYRWSRKTLWAANDMLMLQRQFELESRGMPTRQAIYEAERDIPNYRIPSEVLRNRGVSQALKSPSLFNFGRYHYGLVRSLGEMMKDLVSPAATQQQRWEAAGKLTVLGTIGILGFPALDALLQQVTGNEDATVRRWGPFGPIAAGGTLARNAYQKFTGESADVRNPLGQQLLPGDKEWAAIVAPLLTPAPTWAIAAELVGGKDWMGRDVVDPRASPMGMAVQAGEAAARHIAPLDMAMRSLEEGGGRQALGGLVGLNLPRKTPGPSPRQEQMLRKRARSREKRDPVQNWIGEKLDQLRVPSAGP